MEEEGGQRLAFGQATPPTAAYARAKAKASFARSHTTTIAVSAAGQLAARDAWYTSDAVGRVRRPLLDLVALRGPR